MIQETTNQQRFQAAVQGCCKSVLLVLFSLIVNSSNAQSRSFVQKYRPLADSLSEVYGIPAAVMLGVSIIESSSGTSRNCKLLNNYFGIVGRNNLLKTKHIKTRYKQYPNDTASFADFCGVLSRKKFYNKLKGNMNYKLWVDAISRANYSEVPEVWNQRISAAIRKNKLAATH